MYRINDIKEALLHLIGWRQNDTDWYISSSLTTSESGSYFQQEHALVTLPNIKSVAPDFSSVTYPAYSAIYSYSIGDHCTSSGISYRAKLPSLDKIPADNPTYWEQFDQLSEWIETKTKDGITRCIQRFVNEKLANKTMKALIENKVIFDGAGRLSDTITPEQKIVGFEIIPIRSKGVTLKIEKIGLQFIGQGDMKLYLMHSSRHDVVKEITLTRTRSGSMEWFNMTDLYLPYISDENDAGGSWYLCYDQRETDLTAINRNYDFSKDPCSTCVSGDYRSWSKYLEIHPFKAWMDRGDFNDDFNEDFYRPSLTLWDIQTNSYDYQKNYGINLVVSVHCDVTDFIIEQKDAFKDVLAKTVACQMLEEMAYNASQRINRSVDLSSQALSALNGNPIFRSQGLSNELNTAHKALDIQVQGLDRVCLPCNNGGLRVRAI